MVRVTRLLLHRPFIIPDRTDDVSSTGSKSCDKRGGGGKALAVKPHGWEP